MCDKTSSAPIASAWARWRIVAPALKWFESLLVRVKAGAPRP
ncbi:MAG: hypothetical protein WCP98_14175 [Actinomycetes bacterium]